MNVEQKNISVYFSNLKRTKLEELNSTKDSKIKSQKKDKKNIEKVKIDNLNNYTIQKFFKFNPEDQCINNLKSDLKKLELNPTKPSQFKNINDYFKKENQLPNLSSNQDDTNIFNINVDYPKNKLFDDEQSYQDIKITNWVQTKSTFNFKGLNEDLFLSVIKYINFKDLTKCSLVSRSWKKFYGKLTDSYNYFTRFDTDKITPIELTEMIEKTKKLKHIRVLNQMIKSDYGGNARSMQNRVVVRFGLTKFEDIEHEGALFDHFSINPVRSAENNFLSNTTLRNICISSKYTLRGLALKGCFKLNDSIADSISLCNFIIRLELSYNR
jgi:hypothetical protein